MIDRFGHFGDGMAREVDLRQRTGDGTVPHRRVSAVAHHLSGNLRGVHVGHDHALGPAVEDSTRVEMLKTGHVHDGRNTRVLRGHADLHCGIQRHRAVLHVDEQPVVAAGLHDLADVDAARLAQPDTERELAGEQTLLGNVSDPHGGA